MKLKGLKADIASLYEYRDLVCFFAYNVFDRPLFLAVKVVVVVKKDFLCITIIQSDNGRYTNLLFIQTCGSPILYFYRSSSVISFLLHFSKRKSAAVACRLFNG